MFQIYLSGTFRLDWILQAHKHILLPRKNRLGLEHDIKCQKVTEQSFLKATEAKWRSYQFLYNEDVSWKKQWSNHLKCVPYFLEYTLGWVFNMLYTELSQWWSVWHLLSASLRHTDFRLCDSGHPWMWDRQGAGSSFSLDLAISWCCLDPWDQPGNKSYLSFVCVRPHERRRHPKWQLASS